MTLVHSTDMWPDHQNGSGFSSFGIIERPAPRNIRVFPPLLLENAPGEREPRDCALTPHTLI